jgi:hypothetical protein
MERVQTTGPMASVSMWTTISPLEMPIAVIEVQESTIKMNIRDSSGRDLRPVTATVITVPDAADSTTIKAIQINLATIIEAVEMITDTAAAEATGTDMIAIDMTVIEMTGIDTKMSTALMMV